MGVLVERKSLDKQGTEEEFAEILLESIDKAFSTLGENVKFSIYFNLEAKFRVKREDIPSRIDDFSEAIEKIFGQGAIQLKILIMKHLNERVRCNYKWVGPKWLIPDITFVKYISLVKLAIEKAYKNKR